jgi:hypothetical protein
VIVSDIPVTAQNMFYHLLAVNGVFEPKPYIIVAIWRHIRPHWDREMLHAGTLNDLETRSLFQ